MVLEDCRANSWSLRPCCMVPGLSGGPFLLRLAQKRTPSNNLWAAPVLVLYRIITECFFGYEIQGRGHHRASLYHSSWLCPWVIQ
ncbi:putative acyl transferase [Leclercia adecarboxylata]|uniref:Putative acyl transferase n=1 Tax=Leclercia adecarboxylata TaxID=83655 RepID=A0A4U9I4B1_9ENTR|nr:putative acyl transferase [Leclercia adecarboxylata]